MKILLLSDAPMCANGGGIAQTLYNLFSFADTKDILCITSYKTMTVFPPTEPFESCYVTYNFELIPNNRVTNHFRACVDWFNFNYNEHFRSFKQIKEKIRHFNPEVVISCSNGPVGLFMHHKLLAELNIDKVFPYFMDDWMYQSKSKWLGKKIHSWTKKILSENRAWIMISKNLSELLEERYNIIPNRVLQIHNPVDISDAPAVMPLQEKPEYTLAYAGALWPMHFDAFCIIAKCIKSLKLIRKVRLIVYTSDYFWSWRKVELEPLDVVYGGAIPYENIHKKLSEADAFILTSSFSKEWYTHSKGSLQTKITDYLKAQRIIISCGPSYSANHAFIKRWNCGICIETNDDKEVSQQLEVIINAITEYQPYIDNGWKSLQNFTKEVVQKELQSFLSVDPNSN